MTRNLFKRGAILLALGLTLSLAACGGGSSDPYQEYADAYNKVTANSGIDADLTATVKMDGETVNANGNFKLDDSGSKTLLYLDANVGGEQIVQFSDGDYLYVDSRGTKLKSKLGEKTANNGTLSADAPTYDTASFLKEFAGFLEAGKIRELGLLSPIDQRAVSKTEKNGDTYTLTISADLLSSYVKTLTETLAGSSDNGVSVSNLRDFSYTATESNGVISAVTYQGTADVVIPAAISASGSEEKTTMDLSIQAKFNNPGSSVTIDIPSTDGYEEA